MVIGCIVLAAGKNSRFDKKKSKIFYKIDKIPIIDFTLNKLLSVFNKNNLYITINKKIAIKDKKYLNNYTKNPLIIGGNTRLQSLKNTLQEIDVNKYEYILIHDGARPNISINLLQKIRDKIKTEKYDSVVPYLNLNDTVKKKTKKFNYSSIDRDQLILTQTPQAFKLSFLLKHINKKRLTVTDDVQIIENIKSAKIKYIKGEKENIKITNKSDVSLFKKYLNKNIKIGNGFDIHKLKRGKYLKIAGFNIRSKFESIGHSDGDVVLHSLIDSMLGALQKGDIGEHFPSSNNKLLNVSSIFLLKKIMKKYKLRNTNILNLDLTVICQNLILSKYKSSMRKSLSLLLNCNMEKINIKAKTTDNIGLIGKSKAIACWATILLIT